MSVGVTFAVYDGSTTGDALPLDAAVGAALRRIEHGLFAKVAIQAGESRTLMAVAGNRTHRWNVAWAQDLAERTRQCEQTRIARAAAAA